MGIAELLLIITNIILGIGLGMPLSRFSHRTIDAQKSVYHYFRLCVFIYFIECAVVVMGMGTPVFSIPLALVWGLSLGFWLRKRTTPEQALKLSLLLSLYSCLPVVSFILVPIICAITGWDILSASQGYTFGIPDFLHLPWPLNTILGFYMALIVITLALKPLITTVTVRVLIHSYRRSMERTVAH
ncbi:MAG: hypothetical protein JSV33_06190 [bacterium]|nr:MAG: hypothetical protein JSV33_06190 [bacterium]